MAGPKGRKSDLTKAEQNLRLFLDAQGDYAVVMLDPQGTIISCNKTAELIKGYQSRQILGLHFSVFYPPEDLRAGKPERALKTAVSRGRFREVGPRLRKDGTRFTADVIIAPIFGTRGKLLGFGKIVRDVTQRAAAEAEIRTARKHLRSLLDTVLDTLIDGLIRQFQQRFQARLVPLLPALKTIRNNVVAHHGTNTEWPEVTIGLLNRILYRTVALVDGISVMMTSHPTTIRLTMSTARYQTAALLDAGIDGDGELDIDPLRDV